MQYVSFVFRLFLEESRLVLCKTSILAFTSQKILGGLARDDEHIRVYVVRMDWYGRILPPEDEAIATFGVDGILIVRALMGMAICARDARRWLEEAQFGEEGRIDEETFHLLGSEDFVGIVVRGTWRCPYCFSLVVTAFFLQNMWILRWFADQLQLINVVPLTKTEQAIYSF